MINFLVSLISYLYFSYWLLLDSLSNFMSTRFLTFCILKRRLKGYINFTLPTALAVFHGFWHVMVLSSWQFIISIFVAVHAFIPSVNFEVLLLFFILLFSLMVILPFLALKNQVFFFLLLLWKLDVSDLIQAFFAPRWFISSLLLPSQ